MAAAVGVRAWSERLTPPRTTPGRLRLVLAALLASTAVLWGGLELALTGAHGVVAAAEAHSVPTVVDTAQVAYFLADADRVAVGSFASGTVRLSGPGQRYQDDLKSAHQALERAAEHDATGSTGSGQLQAIEGLLVEYTSLVEQAHATEAQGALGTTYLSYASSLMHKPGDGILTQVQQLQAADRQELRGQGDSGWLASAALYGVLAPAAVALVLLLGTQRYLRRRFHRRINPYLLAASLLLVTLSYWVTAETLRTDHAFTTAGDHDLPRLTASWQARMLASEAAGADALAVVQAVPGQAFSSDFTTYAALLADRPVTSEAIEAARTGSPELHGILADLLHADLGSGSDHNSTQRDAALQTLQDFQQFTAADADLQRQAGQHDPGLVAMTVGLGRTQVGGAGSALDADLSRLTDAGRQGLAESQATARSDLGLGVGIPVLCAAIAALCLAGLLPRIDEYRAAR